MSFLTKLFQRINKFLGLPLLSLCLIPLAACETTPDEQQQGQVSQQQFQGEFQEALQQEFFADKPKRRKRPRARRQRSSATNRGANTGRVTRGDRRQKSSRHSRALGKSMGAKQCQKMHAIFATPYKELIPFRQEAGTPPQGSSHGLFLAKTSPQDCKVPRKRQRIAKAIAKSMNAHSNKVGILLPIQTNKAKFSQFVVEGVRSAFGAAKLSYEENVVFLNPGPTIETTRMAIAKMVFDHNVSLVIGGLDPLIDDELKSWSKKIGIPTILLSKNRLTDPNNRYAFRIYPDQKHLGATLATEAHFRKQMNIAVLRPLDKSADELISYFDAALTNLGGTITKEIPYVPGNYTSMEKATRDLFQINISERINEYKDEIEAAKLKAETLGIPFNKRLVSLKPIVDFDAILIPDDFRSARHFARLFRYQGVQQMPLIGNHEWRSPALLTPYDEFFEDSYFADFIGKYTEIPPALQQGEEKVNPLFAAPETALATDFRLIGFYAGKYGASVLTKNFKKRRQIPSYLAKLKTKGSNGGNPSANRKSTSPTYAGKSHFDDKGNNLWPTYLFRVSKGALETDRVILDAKFLTKLKERSPQQRQKKRNTWVPAVLVPKAEPQHVKRRQRKRPQQRQRPIPNRSQQTKRQTKQRPTGTAP